MTFMDENRVEETLFPLPGFTHIIDGNVMLPNSSNFPVSISKNQHLADIRMVSNRPSVFPTTVTEQFYPRPRPQVSVNQCDKIQLDPDNIFSPDEEKLFQDVVHQLEMVHLSFGDIIVNLVIWMPGL